LRISVASTAGRFDGLGNVGDGYNSLGIVLSVIQA
jgi:hypothetical protein